MEVHNFFLDNQSLEINNKAKMTVCFDFILVYFNTVCQSGFSLVEFENKGQFFLGDFLSKVIGLNWFFLSNCNSIPRY